MSGHLNNFSVLLEDRSNPARNPVAVTINADETGIGIRIEGYGKKDHSPGEIIIIEVFAGRVQMKVWGDITRHDPTHNIGLDYARESRRKEVSDDAASE